MQERIAAVVERLLDTDPDVVAAAAEQDVQLLVWFASLTPAERLARAGRSAFALQRLRNARVSP